MSQNNENQTSGQEQPKVVTVNLSGKEFQFEMSDEGKLIVPTEQQPAFVEALSIINKAVDDATAGGEVDTANGSEVADQFRGLPMSELIGAPLFAVADAQQRLAGISWDFYQKIAYEKKDGTAQKTRILEFELERPVVLDGVVGGTEKQTVRAPFIGLVPIPSLLIEKVDIDFQMEVTDTNVSKSESSAEATASVSAKWFGTTVNVSGKVASSRENTRTTNQTAKYQVHVTAAQQRPTEGLSKLMDIMAACIEPVPSKS